MKKKILHIVLESSFNGATVYAYRLCTKLEEFDHTIISCFKGNAYEEILKKGIKCENLLSSHNISYKYLLVKYWRFLRYIRRHSFDIIHYHQGGIGILLLAFFFRNNAKIIHHFHHANLIGDNTKQSISALHLIILKYLATRSYQVAVAKQVFDEYTSNVEDIRNLKLIRNSQPFAFKKKESRTNTIGFIGRFTKEKGFPLVVQISQRLKEIRSDLKMVIMGEESKIYEDEFWQKLTNIEFLMPTFDIQSFYKSVDAVLFLSSSPEGLPLVVLEAVSFDVGLIAFPVAGVIEILGNNYPLYAKSSEEVIEKLELYYSDKIDLDELSQFHERINKEYSYEEMLTAIRQIYSQCLSN